MLLFILLINSLIVNASWTDYEKLQQKAWGKHHFGSVFEVGKLNTRVHIDIPMYLNYGFYWPGGTSSNFTTSHQIPNPKKFNQRCTLKTLEIYKKQTCLQVTELNYFWGTPIKIGSNQTYQFSWSMTSPPPVLYWFNFIKSTVPYPLSVAIQTNISDFRKSIGKNTSLLFLPLFWLTNITIIQTKIYSHRTFVDEKIITTMVPMILPNEISDGIFYFKDTRNKPFFKK